MTASDVDACAPCAARLGVRPGAARCRRSRQPTMPRGGAASSGPGRRLTEQRRERRPSAVGQKDAVRRKRSEEGAQLHQVAHARVDLDPAGRPRGGNVQLPVHQTSRSSAGHRHGDLGVRSFPGGQPADVVEAPVMQASGEGGVEVAAVTQASDRSSERRLSRPLARGQPARRASAGPARTPRRWPRRSFRPGRPHPPVRRHPPADHDDQVTGVAAPSGR